MAAGSSTARHHARRCSFTPAGAVRGSGDSEHHRSHRSVPQRGRRIARDRRVHRARRRPGPSSRWRSNARARCGNQSRRRGVRTGHLRAAAVGKPAEGLLVGGWRGQPGVRTEVHGKIHRRLRGNVERTEHHVLRIAARVQLGAAAAGAVRRGRSRGWSLRRDVATQAERVSCPVTVQHRAMGSSTAALQPVFAKGT